jgi:hypothetical protein
MLMSPAGLKPEDCDGDAQQQMKITDPTSSERVPHINKPVPVIHIIGSQTRDLPACSIAPQPSTLPLAPLPKPLCSKMFN